MEDAIIKNSQFSGITGYFKVDLKTTDTANKIHEVEGSETRAHCIA